MNFPGAGHVARGAAGREPGLRGYGGRKSSQPQAGRGAGDAGPEMGRLEPGTSESVFREVTVHSDKAEPRARCGEGRGAMGTSEWEEPLALQGWGDACR